MCDQRLHLVPTADIARERAGMRTQCAGHTLGGFAVDVCHDDACAFAHIGLGNAFTKAAAGAGDDGNFFIQLGHDLAFLKVNREIESPFWWCSFLLMREILFHGRGRCV